MDGVNVIGLWPITAILLDTHTPQTHNELTITFGGESARVSNIWNFSLLWILYNCITNKKLKISIRLSNVKIYAVMTYWLYILQCSSSQYSRLSYPFTISQANSSWHASFTQLLPFFFDHNINSTQLDNRSGQPQHGNLTVGVARTLYYWPLEGGA